MRFYEFVKEMWPALNNFPFKDNFHVEAICDHLQGVSDRKIKKLIINVPPGSGSSVIASVCWPAWEWSRYPTESFIYFSFHEELACRDCSRTKSLIESNLYKSKFNTLLNHAPSRILIKVQDGGFLRSFTLSSSGSMGFKADTVVFDTPNNPWDREKLIRSIEFDRFQNCLSQQQNSSFVVIQSKLSSEDISSKLIEQGGWERLMIPAEFDPARRFVTSIGWSDPRTTEFEPMFPQVFSKEYLDKKKSEIGLKNYCYQFQQYE